MPPDVTLVTALLPHLATIFYSLLQSTLVDVKSFQLNTNLRSPCLPCHSYFPEVHPGQVKLAFPYVLFFIFLLVV